MRRLLTLSCAKALSLLAKPQSIAFSHIVMSEPLCLLKSNMINLHTLYNLAFYMGK
jgi:hypothetical protein